MRHPDARGNTVCTADLLRDIAAGNPDKGLCFSLFHPVYDGRQFGYSDCTEHVWNIAVFIAHIDHSYDCSVKIDEESRCITASVNIR